MSKFEEGNQEQLKEFLNRLNDLVEEFHPNIYLIDDVFKGVRTIEVAIKGTISNNKESITYCGACGGDASNCDGC